MPARSALPQSAWQHVQDPGLSLCLQCAHICRLGCADLPPVAALQADVSYQHQYIIKNTANSSYYGHVNVGIQENR